MSMESALAAKQALIQQNIAIAAMKSAAAAQAGLAGAIAESVRAAPSGGRGSVVDISA